MVYFLTSVQKENNNFQIYLYIFKRYHQYSSFCSIAKLAPFPPKVEKAVHATKLVRNNRCMYKP